MSDYEEAQGRDEREAEDDYALDKGNLDEPEKEQEEDLERERSPGEG